MNKIVNRLKILYSESFKNLRIENDMAWATLAKQLNLTKSVIGAYESDLRLPSYDILVQITKLFRVSSDYLFSLEFLSGLTDEEKSTVKKFNTGYEA